MHAECTRGNGEVFSAFTFLLENNDFCICCNYQDGLKYQLAADRPESGVSKTY